MWPPVFGWMGPGRLVWICLLTLLLKEQIWIVQKYRSVEHCEADGTFECGSMGPYYTVLGCGFPQIVLNVVTIFPSAAQL